MGIQGRSQMEKRYGQDAEAMLSQPATKIFLKTSEPRAAKWISEAIGEIELERLKESRSMGPLRSKKSFALEIATKPLIMASEIAGLAPLRGFIKLENHVVPARFRLAKKRNKQPEFLERPREKPLPRKADAVKILAPTKTPETKKPVQAVSPMEEKSAVKREGFSWDESKGIE
jgi:type IV secretory pathway TraG/TraD family ATPase VirD4